MGNNWLLRLRQIVEGDEEIEEMEVKVEYEDGSKRKWTFAEDGVLIEEDIDEEDDEDDEGDEEDEDGDDEEVEADSDDEEEDDD
ncbi:DNA primase [Brevibacillus sp. TJ4]|uniref:DNA primase n=1 Tax=Brevibacillus sp. TJ4 TaxID=3234853 RepID=UPI0037D5AC4C